MNLTIRFSPLIFLYSFIVLVIFTALRNLTTIYMGIVGLGLIIFLIKNLSSIYKFHQSFLPYYLFIFMTFFVIIWSFFYMQSLEPISGIPRILLMPLLALILLLHVRDDKDFETLLKVICFCFLVGALSLIYQFFFGTVSWFAASATRGVLVRYTSILGSLTVFGSIVGYLVILIYGPLNLFKNALSRFIFLTSLLVAMALSLSKTSMLIFGIASILLLFYNLRYEGLSIKAGNLSLFILLILSIPIIITFNPTLQTYASSLLTIVAGIDASSISSSLVDVNDVRTSTLSWYSITERLYGFTLLAYKEYGNFLWLFGVGLKGGAGVMGMEGISAHNGFLELFLMGGPIYLLITILMILDLQFFLLRDIKNKLSATFFLLNSIFIIIAIVTSGALFQPSISILFWLSLAYVYNKRIRSYKLSE